MGEEREIRFTPESFAIRFLSASMAIGVSIIGVGIIMMLFGAGPPGIQPGLLGNLWQPDRLGPTLVASMGILLLIFVPIVRVLGTSLILLREGESNYAASGMIVFLMLAILVILSA